MVTDILVPVDGSDPAAAAFDHALEIAADVDGTLHVLNVADTNELSFTRIGNDVVDAHEQEGEGIVSRAQERAEDRGVDVVTDVRQGEPREEIVSYSERVDLVVMGAHGRHGLGEYILGTTTDYVVNASTVPVLTVRAAEGVTQSYPYETILVPTDGSDHAIAAVELAAEIADRIDAALHLLYVIDELPELESPIPAEVTEPLEDNAQEILDESAAVATQVGLDDDVIHTAVASGSVPHEIRARVDAIDADLIVMGTHGHTGLDRHLLGSFAENVLRTASVPVLTVKDDDRRDRSF